MEQEEKQLFEGLDFGPKSVSLTATIKGRKLGSLGEETEAHLRPTRPTRRRSSAGKGNSKMLWSCSSTTTTLNADNTLEQGNKCGKCQNHEFEVSKKGHARDCPFKKCECLKCRLLDARSDILQVISGKETKLKGTKKDPNCGFCQNHGVKILRKGHVRSCGFGQERHFKLDNCFDCEVHYIRNEVNRLQIKMRRAMKEDRTLSEEQRKTAREAITRDEVEKVCDMARLARKKREKILTQQMVSDELVSTAGSTPPAVGLVGQVNIPGQPTGQFEPTRKRLMGQQQSGNGKNNANSANANLLHPSQHNSSSSTLSSSTSLLVKEEQLMVDDQLNQHNHLLQQRQQQPHQLAGVWRPWSQHQVAAAIAAQQQQQQQYHLEQQQQQLATFNGNHCPRNINLAGRQAGRQIPLNNQPPSASLSIQQHQQQHQQHLASLLNSAAIVGPDHYLINSIQQQQQQQLDNHHRQAQQVSFGTTNIQQQQQQLPTLNSSHDDSSTSSTSVNIDVDCSDDEDDDQDADVEEDNEADDNVSTSSLATECHMDTSINSQQQQQSFHHTPPQSPRLLPNTALMATSTCSNIATPNNIAASPMSVQEPLQLTHQNNSQQQQHLPVQVQSQQTQQQQQQLFDTIFRLIFAQFAQSNGRT